jgi:hypothetical protein
MAVRSILRHVATPILAIFAVLYFLIDALFLSLLRPVGRLIGRLDPAVRLGNWVRSLSPYCALTLFLVPLIVLEPAKPVGFFLIASGRAWAGVAVIGIGEVLKILIVERLFHVSRNKLLSIGWFARLYRLVTFWLDWLRRRPAWQASVRLLSQSRVGLRRLFRVLIHTARRAIG